MKRIVSVFLTFIMIVGLLSTTGFSERAESAPQHKVLFWCTESTYAEYSNCIAEFYSEMDDVTVVTKTSGALTSDELNGVQLVYIVSFSSIEGQNMINAAPLLKDFARNGGRVVMNGEHSGFAGAGNATLSELAAEMGGNFTIKEGSITNEDMIFNTEEKAEVTKDLTSYFRPRAFAPIESTNSDAIWVAKDSYGNVFVMDQKVENGYITALADINWVYDGNDDVNVKAQAKQFLRNLLLDSAQNMQKFSGVAPTVTGPQDKTVSSGKIDEKLSVTITVDTEDEYEISYQWYKSQTGNNEDGIAISGATNSTFSIPSDLEAGAHYFYCIVTATYKENGAAISTVSSVAKVIVRSFTTSVEAESGVPDTKTIGFDEELAMKLLTDEEIQQYEEGTPVKVYMTVKPEDASTVPERDRELIEKKITENGEKLGAYLDLSLWKQIGNASAAKIEDTNNNKIKVTVNVPEDLINTSKSIGRTYHIVRVHDGVVDVLAESTETTITFETDKFSTYAITYQDQDVSTEVPKTGDNSHITIWIMLMITSAISTLVVTAFVKKGRVFDR